MFIYTVKLTVDNKDKDQFIEYLYQQHLPDVMETGCFTEYNIKTHIMSDEIIAKYKCNSQEDYDRYLIQYADSLRQDVIQKFPNSIINIERDFNQTVVTTINP